MELNGLFDHLARSAKPRSNGLTSVIDIGYGDRIVESQLESCALHLDLAKFGFGTSLLTQNLARKIATYRSFEVEVCFGGTLFEFFYLRSRLDDYKQWLSRNGLSVVEISDGSIEFPGDTKLELIAEFARDFTVISEVGSKDSSAIVSPSRWVKMIQSDLDAGASWVILEGRESGTAGLYRASGEMRTGLVDEVLEAGFESDQLIFETPKKEQQTYLIGLLGPNVNLANIGLFDVLPCESLRRGLRGDTLTLLNAPA